MTGSSIPSSVSARGGKGGHCSSRGNREATDNAAESVGTPTSDDNESDVPSTIKDALQLRDVSACSFVIVERLKRYN